MLNYEDFRARHSNDDDAFAAAIAAAKSGNDPRIEFYGAITLFRSPPPIDRVHIFGRDIYGAVIVPKFTGGVLFRHDGRDGYSGGGLHNFSISGGSHLAGTYAILARTRPGYGPHGLQLDNLYIGGGFYRAIELVGHDNPNLNTQTGALGLRQPRLSNVTVFGTAAPASVYLHWTADARIEGLRLFQAGGAYADLNAAPANNPGLSVVS